VWLKGTSVADEPDASFFRMHVLYVGKKAEDVDRRKENWDEVGLLGLVLVIFMQIDYRYNLRYSMLQLNF
jgi:hypothetical protein